MRAISTLKISFSGVRTLIQKTTRPLLCYISPTIQRKERVKL